MRSPWPSALVHTFTASGAVCGLLALHAGLEARWEALFVWLGIALIIDGIDGTFADSMEAAKLVVKHGFRFQVNTTICRNNLHELPEILTTVKSMGANMWYLLFLVPMGRGSNLEPLTPDEMEDVLH